MTLISNLEDYLDEELSEEQLQQISGGLNLTGVVSSEEAEARNRKKGNILQDAAVGSAASVVSASVSDRLPLAATYVTGPNGS